MSENVYLKLRPSEAQVLQVASRIFAAYMVSNKVNAENEQQLIDKSLELAIAMAKKIDEMVISDDELL